MVDRVRNRRHRWHDSDLADTANSQRMARVRYLDNYRLDHRQGETRRHPVIQKARVTQDALFVVEIFLVQGPSGSLSHTALHLPFHVARVECPPRGPRYRGAHYL